MQRTGVKVICAAAAISLVFAVGYAFAGYKSAADGTQISRDTLQGSEVQATSGAGYQMSSCLGQSASQVSTNGQSYSLSSGFLHMEFVPADVHGWERY